MDLLAELETVAIQPFGDARAFPFGAYRDAEVFDLEMMRVFLNDWVFACTAKELHAPGAYYAFRLGGEPVVVLRGKDGELRALSNVCRHRGTQLLDDGFGQVERLIICPYHAWAYDDAGAFRAAPFAKQIKVEPSAHGLTRFAVEQWMGLVFVHLGSAPPPFGARVAGMEPYLELFAPGRFQAASSGPIELWQTNWKLALENALETYHLFAVHAETLEPVTPTRQAYYVAGHSEWSLTGGRTEPDSHWLGRLWQQDYPDIYNHYLLMVLPPSFVGILSYDSLAWLSVHPVDAGTTVIRSGSVGEHADELDDEGQRAFTASFFAEDRAICERVQRSMGARKASGGRLVDLERVVVDFHQYLATRLFDAPTTALHRSADGARFLEAPP